MPTRMRNPITIVVVVIVHESNWGGVGGVHYGIKLHT